MCVCLRICLSYVATTHVHPDGGNTLNRIVNMGLLYIAPYARTSPAAQHFGTHPPLPLCAAAYLAICQPSVPFGSAQRGKIRRVSNSPAPPLK